MGARKERPLFMAEMELEESCFNLTWKGGNWDRRTNYGVWRWGEKCVGKHG